MLTICNLCCCDPCNKAIDAAVTRLHAAFRERLLALFEEPVAPAKREGEPWSGTGAASLPEEIRPNGRPFAAGRPDVTLEAIRALQAQQMSRGRIAKALGCSKNLVKARIAAAEVAG